MTISLRATSRRNLVYVLMPRIHVNGKYAIPTSSVLDQSFDLCGMHFDRPMFSLSCHLSKYLQNAISLNIIT